MPDPIFFLDENISWRIAKALQALEHEVVHLLDELPQGTTDTTYFPYIAERGWFLITQDKKIRKKPHERKAMVEAGVGAFILTGQANKSTDEFTVHLLDQ